MFFRGLDNTVCVYIKVYLVDNLKAKLLIGIDIIGYKGFRLDFDTKIVKILSYIGLTVPISIYTKPYHTI